MIAFIAVTALTFTGMEGVSYLSHRYLMHGVLWNLHQSHHTERTGLLEKNDFFPLLFATPAAALIAAGLVWPQAWVALAAGIGATLYGAAYSLVHDGVIHRRFPVPLPRWRMLEQIRRAHLVHHATGGEPYGMFHVRRDIRERVRIRRTSTPA